MFFFPYRVDLELKYLPILTIAVCVTCILTLYLQYSNNRAIEQASFDYCQSASRFFEMILNTIPERDGAMGCGEFMLYTHSAQNSEKKIEQMISSSEGLKAFSKARGHALITQVLTEQYASFAATAPQYLTKRLWYEPTSWNPIKMITAVFTHADWQHLLGNLFFFFAFAAAVELIVGALGFAAILVGSALFTGMFYSLSSLTASNPLPTVGLSGVVMTMMALFVFFLPTGKIRCLLWVVLIFRTFAVPAWILAIWYIGWDFYHLFWVSGDTSINLVAHISGAAFGYLLGLLLLRERRTEIREMSYV